MYYQNVLHRLEQRYIREPDAADEIRNRLLEEWGQIEFIRDWCAEHAAQDDGAAILCAKFAGVGGNLLEATMPRPKQIDWIEAAVAATNRVLTSPKLPDQIASDLRRDLVGHFTHLGFAHLMSRNVIRARELCELGLELAREHRDRKAEGTALSHLAMIALTENDRESATHLLRDALAAFEGVGDLAAQAAAWSTLGSVASGEEAVGHLDRAIAIFEQVPNAVALGTALANRGAELLSLGRRDEARLDLERAYKLAGELNLEGLRGLALANFAKLFASDPDPTVRGDAIETLENACHAFEFSGDALQLSRTRDLLEHYYRSALEEHTGPLSYEQRSYALRKLGILYRQKREHDKATEVYERLLRIAEDSRDLSDQLEALAYLGTTRADLEQYEDAVRLHERALEVLTRQRSAGVEIRESAECQILISLGQAYRHLSRPREAIARYDGALETAPGHSLAALLARGNRALARVDLGEYDAAIADLTDLIEAFRASGDYRLMAHARFNLAYAHHRRGEHADARHHGEKAVEILQRISDPTAEEVRRQMAGWPECDDA